MPDTAKPGSNVRVWGSDVIAAAIHEQGFPYAVLNPGASYRGLHDSLVNYLGGKPPKMLVVMHEEHAIGVAQGYATLGAIGFEGRWEYSCIGGVANLSARLCSEAKGGQILTNQKTLCRIEDLVRAEALGNVGFKGLANAIPVFNVTGLAA
jgi:hypothetical protein